MRISDWSSDVCSSDLVGRGGGLLLFVLVLLEAGTGGLGADLAVAGVLVAFHLIGGRVLREPRLKVENLAKLHAPFVQRDSPVDDGVEGQRAFAQPGDPRFEIRRAHV